MPVPIGLFESHLPSGFQYREKFITKPQERQLLDVIASVEFSHFEMRGVVARRRVAFFGESYDRKVAGPIPPILLPLRSAIAAWAGVTHDAFAMALINEDGPGSPIGWHRDTPQYDIVAGVSLLSTCRMGSARTSRPGRPWPTGASPPMNCLSSADRPIS